MRTARRLTMKALTIGAACIAMLAPPLRAQSPTRTLFLHGFPGSGSDLATIENLLLGTFSTAISPRRPHVANQYDGLALWPSQLTSYVAGGDTHTVAIAHSTGGVAARALDRAPGGALYGAITFGSPLGGALVANNRYAAYYWMQAMRGGILNLLNDYTSWLTNWEWWLVDGGFGYIQAGSFGALAARFAPTLSAQTSTDLQTNSSYMAGPDGLNGSTNLAREALALGDRRLAIVARAPSDIQVCAGLSNAINRQDCTNAQNGAITTFVVMEGIFSGYSNESNPNAALIRAHAVDFLGAANAIYNADAKYCSFIASFQDMEGLGCRADGYIAASLQIWPGAGPAAWEVADVGGHSNEPSNTEIASAVGVLMQTRLGIYPPPPPPPPPPQWNAVIQGQTTIAPSAQCTWWGATSGTAEPGAIFSYTWKVNGVTQQSGTQEYLVYGDPTPPFEIELTIVAENGTRTGYLWVELDANGWCQ